MSEEPSEADASSRRGWLRAAGVGLAGAVVAGCGKTSLRAQVDNSQPVLHTDVDLLQQLLHLEHMGIAAYTAGTPLLAPATVKAGKLFLNDELSHAGALGGLIKAAGGKPNKPPPSYDLGHPRNSREVLTLLHEIEQAQIKAYLAALPRLAPASVRQSVASILANDAQHVAVVRAALGQTAVPSAFVTGRE
ncbi:MAG TPA: ferritin-like domain-containing protein [Solirubrobacteraceae bacterium]|nr:ferritin-like domain-containing protein [Solirubrobacteraceae bacterium]